MGLVYVSLEFLKPATLGLAWRYPDVVGGNMNFKAVSITSEKEVLFNGIENLNSLTDEELLSDITKRASQAQALFKLAKTEIHKRIVGMDELIDCAFLALLTNQHILIEGNTGLGKTSFVKTFAEIISGKFTRIQFTNDTMPSDITGYQMWHPAKGEKGDFIDIKGKVFSNVILADEINRAPAKVHSGFLEAMGEGQVSINGHTYKLHSPFLVLATQNPLDDQGTHVLPQAQIDRFMFQVKIDQLTKEELIQMMQTEETPEKDGVQELIHAREIEMMQSLVKKIYIDKNLLNYIAEICLFVQNSSKSEVGKLIDTERPISPRAVKNMRDAARAHAFISGRAYVTADDVQAVAKNILRHRLIPSYEAKSNQIESVEIIEKILKLVPLPH